MTSPGRPVDAVFFDLFGTLLSLTPLEDTEAIFKDTVKLMNEMTDVLKPVKDKAGAERTHATATLVAHDVADELGRAGRERVRSHFLTTRDLTDYLQLFQRLRERRQAA